MMCCNDNDKNSNSIYNHNDNDKIMYDNLTIAIIWQYLYIIRLKDSQTKGHNHVVSSEGKQVLR